METIGATNGLNRLASQNHGPTTTPMTNAANPTLRYQVRRSSSNQTTPRSLLSHSPAGPPSVTRSDASRSVSVLDQASSRSSASSSNSRLAEGVERVDDDSRGMSNEQLDLPLPHLLTNPHSQPTHPDPAI